MAYFPSVKMPKIQLVKALVSERLSVAAEEIFRIVERTLVEYEEEASHSKWMADRQHRLLDVTQMHKTDSVQVTVTEVKVPSGHHQPSAKWSPGPDPEKPEDVALESTDGCGTLFAANPDSSPGQSENSESDQEILTDLEDEDVRQACDLTSQFKILKVKKPYKCPVCMSMFSSKKTARRHVGTHSGDRPTSHQCQLCDRYFCHKSDLIVHARIHTDPHLARTISDDVPSEQKWSPGLGQQNPQPSQPKAEGQELKTDEEDEQLQGLAPDRTVSFVTAPFDRDPVQPPPLYQQPPTKDRERNLPTSLVHRFKVEPIGEDCVAAEVTAVSQPVYAAHSNYFAAQNEHGDRLEEVEGLSTSVLSELKHLTEMGLLPERAPGRPYEPSVQFDVQTVQKPYLCPHCGKGFSLTKTLMRHVKIHTGDKLYMCQFCRRNFCQKSDLVTHIRIHTGERPYQCQECHKSFSHKSNLTVHMKTHTRHKPCLYNSLHTS